MYVSEYRYEQNKTFKNVEPTVAVLLKYHPLIKKCSLDSEPEVFDWL